MIAGRYIYQLALSVITKSYFPYDWATTQHNLGNAYCQRIAHDRDIQSLIDQGTAMIEWYVTRDKILTFIVTSHSQQPIVVPSSPEKLKTLEEWDKDYTNAYRNQKNQWITDLSSRLAELATILDIDNIISKIDGIFEKVGGKCDRLILVPHRFLHLFPLHALPLSKGNLLIDRFERGVSYAPSSQLPNFDIVADR
ncbi:MAG: hypothetical protein F6K53_42830 [Moorea sp. SIO4A1]|uniref:hypothetical protein n=1 Tax=Moorena sp. SIO4A1 TaxID=2607835 RepID=UPI00144D3E8A|nr:hypothetical protein [Moorena sp. SIO4A1]NEQ63682.1 hypothetical protein [Moorena sp. SIO4A1]